MGTNNNEIDYEDDSEDGGDDKMAAFENLVREWTPKLAAAFVRIAALALGIGLSVYAWNSVHDLFFVNISAGEFFAWWSATASVGILLMLTVLIVGVSKNSVRGMSMVLVVPWVLVVFSLVGIRAWFDGSRMIGDLGEAPIMAPPEALIGLGRMVAAMIPGLGLLPVLLLALAFGAPDDKYRDTGHAISVYVGNLLKFASIGASFMATAYFGLSRYYIGEDGARVYMNEMLAVSLALLIEGSFVWSFLELSNANRTRDRFDIWAWRIATLLGGLMISLMSFETISELASIKTAISATAQALGSLVYLSAIAISVALMVVTKMLTSFIDYKADKSGKFKWRFGGSDPQADVSPVERDDDFNDAMSMRPADDANFAIPTPSGYKESRPAAGFHNDEAMDNALSGARNDDGSLKTVIVPDPKRTDVRNGHNGGGLTGGNPMRAGDGTDPKA